MQFIHTWKQVLDESKTQTSRIVKPGDHYHFDDDDNRHFVEDANGRLKWRKINTYAVQPGHGKKAVARIRILKIRQMDVREFTPDDIKAEGFVWKGSFFQTWCEMIDHRPPSTLNELYTRPAERYQAWVLGFELVNDDRR